MAKILQGRTPMQTILSHVGSYCLLVSMAFGQAGQAQPQPDGNSKVSDAIARMNAGEFRSYDLEVIRVAHATEAVPALERQFARIEVPPEEPKNLDDLDKLLDKAKIASVLVKFGNRDDRYWDFLVKLATPVITSDAPGFMAYDQQGNPKSGPSPEFTQWAKAHHVSPSDGHVAENNVYIHPSWVAFLGLTGDPRAVPLLRRALLSPNGMIKIWASMGLAEVGDKDSIPLVIQACKRSPATEASAIAESLVYFDDPEAQRAVDTYVSKEVAKTLRESKAVGKNSPWSQ